MSKTNQNPDIIEAGTNPMPKSPEQDLLKCPKCGNRTVKDKSGFIVSEYKCTNPDCDYHYFDAGVETVYDYE